MAKKPKSGGKKGKKDKGLKGDYANHMNEDGMLSGAELVLHQFKQKQAAEVRAARINELKIQDQWRALMRAAKTDSLKTAIEMLQQTHARRLDRKNAMLNQLDKSVNESEEQFQTAVQAHLLNVDHMILMQGERLAYLEKQFEENLTLVENEFLTERNMLKEKHEKEKQDIIGIMSRMEQEYAEAESDAKHEYQGQRDDVRNKNLEEKHALRIQLEGAVEELWRQFQAAWTNYNSSTEERKQQFEMLKNKDQNSAKIIDQQMRKLQRLQDGIAHLKTKLSHNAKEFEERNRALRDEKEALQRHFQDLKLRMNQHREREKRKLTDLARLSRQVRNDLKDKVERAEAIIELAEMNRKLETQDELVLASRQRFEALLAENGVPTEGWQETAAREATEAMAQLQASMGDSRPMSSVAQSAPLPHAAQHAPDIKEMQLFYERYNKVLLDKLSLEASRRLLQEENDNLRTLLKQYLDGVSVNDSVMRQPNPLLVVNGRVNVNLRLLHHSDQPHHITCIEANQVVQNSSFSM